MVRSPTEIYGLMERGAMQRATGSTKLNELSSRSHAVFIIIVENSRVSVENDGAAGGASDQQRPSRQTRAGAHIAAWDPG